MFLIPPANLCFVHSRCQADYLSRQYPKQMPSTHHFQHSSSGHSIPLWVGCNIKNYNKLTRSRYVEKHLFFWLARACCRVVSPVCVFLGHAVFFMNPNISSLSRVLLFNRWRGWCLEVLIVSEHFLGHGTYGTWY